MTAAPSFDQAFRSWAEAACAAWDYEPVSEAWIDDAYRRLPLGLRLTLGHGLTSGAIQTVEGFKFQLPHLPEGKGPYAWLGKSATEAPAVHWEYYVQVAEYVRLLESTGNRVVSFEDDLMDVTVYDAGEVILACEVKERSGQLGPLLEGIRKYGRGFDAEAPDRGNDSLRKAKYISKARPRYFSLVAIGHRREFSVDYQPDGTWMLVDDVVPIL